MKKVIIIAVIAVIAVLNFSLVASKSGNASLKSLTTLAKANADSEHPDIELSTALICLGSGGPTYHDRCQLNSDCNDTHASQTYTSDHFRRTAELLRWNGTEYAPYHYVYEGWILTSIYNWCKNGHNGYIYKKPLNYTE